MTTNESAIARVLQLEQKGQELIENGHNEVQVMKMLNVYHNKWYVVSHTTKKDDLDKVRSRLFE